MIDLSDMTYEQLFELHEEVVKRLRYLADLRTRATLDRYQVGDRVKFDDGRGRTVGGVVLRINKKSLTVQTPRGRWSGIPPFAVTQHIASDKPNKLLDAILKHR